MCLYFSFFDKIYSLLDGLILSGDEYFKHEKTCFLNSRYKIKVGRLVQRENTVIIPTVNI